MSRISIEAHPYPGQENASLKDWAVLSALTRLPVPDVLEPDEIRLQIRELIDFQRKFQTGCLFNSAYMAAAAFGNRLLPRASEFLKTNFIKYKHILAANSLSPSHRHFNEALSVYRDLRVEVTQLTMNEEAAKILSDNGVSLESLSVPTEKNSSWKPLSYDHLKPPFGVWVHQLGCNDSHFITIDGSPEADELVSDYIAQQYRPIATLQFAPLSKN